MMNCSHMPPRSHKRANFVNDVAIATSTTRFPPRAASAVSCISSPFTLCSSFNYLRWLPHRNEYADTHRQAPPHVTGVACATFVKALPSISPRKSILIKRRIGYTNVTGPVTRCVMHAISDMMENHLLLKIAPMLVGV
jgi:hypothetical protein